MIKQEVTLAQPAKVNGKFEPAGKKLTVSDELAEQLRAAGVLETGEARFMDAIRSWAAGEIEPAPDGEQNGDAETSNLIARIAELEAENEDLMVEAARHDDEMKEARVVDHSQVVKITDLEAKIVALEAVIAEAETKIIAHAVEAAQLQKSLDDMVQQPADGTDEPAETKPAKAAAKAATGKTS